MIYILEIWVFGSMFTSLIMFKNGIMENAINIFPERYKQYCEDKGLKYEPSLLKFTKLIFFVVLFIAWPKYLINMIL